MEKVGHKMENSSDFIKNFPFYLSDFSNGKIKILKPTDTFCFCVFLFCEHFML